MGLSYRLVTTMANYSILGTICIILTVLLLSTLTTVSSITNTKSFLFKRYPYLDWIRSPTPLNVYPKIFQRIIPRDPARVKKSATSHSTNWGKRSSEEDKLFTFPQHLPRFKIPWKIIRQGLKRSGDQGQKEFVKRMWMPAQKVRQPAIRRRQVEKDGNEKKEERWRGTKGVVSSRLFDQLYKRLRKPGTGNSFSERAAQIFFLTKQPIIGKRKKRRIGMIQKAKIFEDEEFPFHIQNPSTNNSCCHLLDKISQKLCLYILKNSAQKFHSLCAGGCFKEENSVDYRKREGGGPDNLNEGTGKKFRKIFVRI